MGSTAEDFVIKPMKGEHGFGAEIYGLDVNNITDEQVDRLRDTIQRYLLVVLKHQHDETPQKNWELLNRLSPDAPKFTPEEWALMYNPDPQGAGILPKLGYLVLPGTERLFLMGKGYQGEDHWGLKDIDIPEVFADAYYSKPLPHEDYHNGVARFQSWHIDGPSYKIDHPMFTSFRIIKFPEGEQTVDWADGSGLTKKVKAGRTAFFSSAKLYDMLTKEEQAIADYSWAEYMYFPYEWILRCRGNPQGLNVACEGREVPDEQMDAMPRNPEDQLVLPLVWVNPVTGGKHFHVQPNIVRRVFVRSGPDEEPKIIDDVKEVRDFFTKFQYRIIRPENIYVGPEEEGDQLLFFNWGVMHSKIDYPIEMGTRTTHQGWLAGDRPPKGPVPIPDPRARSNIYYQK
ncbi:hypothetical protein N8I77_004304 [Diaporthe amygdali]|uniref:TauD/TfdA-like domain-containing protein n=1 Tax=Phomopsis amygdali TaxID=1214568 RepID=A0AAD9W6V2_PHOAM|nr:hypothetical protein N8I77_004304 [Diaporthe amygdali]